MRTDVISREGGHQPLAAILCVEIGEHNHLLELDDAGVPEGGEGRRLEIVAPAVAQYGGQVVQTADESFLAIFERPVEAVHCALAIRDRVAHRNKSSGRQSYIRYC